MIYDQSVSSGSLNIQLKRRVWRVDFQRPPVEGAGSLFARCFLKEDLINAEPAHQNSGSVISTTSWMITLDKDTILDRTGAGPFFSDMISTLNDIKSEFDSTGTTTTGSIRLLNV